MDLENLIKFLKNANAPSSLITFVINNIKTDEFEKKSQKSKKKKVK